MLQEESRVPAVAWEQSAESKSDLEPALIVFCNKVDSYRKDAGIPGMTQLAWRLLEVAPEARPTAQQVTEDMGFFEAKSPMPYSLAAPMGLRGAEAPTAPMHIRGALDTHVVELAVRFKDYLAVPGDLVAF